VAGSRTRPAAWQGLQDWFYYGRCAIPALRRAFYDALRMLGWIESKNFVIEERYSENRLDRLPALVAELVRLNVDVIVAAGTLAPLAAKKAIATIPIVMTSAGDPLGAGLVASLALPGVRAGGRLKKLNRSNRGPLA
jgi:ABC-type uncharacterized transport system substrate-binding protein